MPTKTLSEEEREQKRAYHREWRKNNKAKVSTAAKRWRESHLEQARAAERTYELRRDKAKRRASTRKRYADNPELREKRKAALREWYKKTDKNEVLRKNRLWIKENRDQARQTKRAYFESHREQNTESRRKWKRNNPQQIKADNAARNNRIRKVGGKIATTEVLALYESQGGRCAACNKNLKMKYHLDHIMPIALGGKHEIGNAQILCPPCNLSKRALHPDLWAKRIGKLFI